jgi:hypothetical protein
MRPKQRRQEKRIRTRFELVSVRTESAQKLDIHRFTQTYSERNAQAIFQKRFLERYGVTVPLPKIVVRDSGARIPPATPSQAQVELRPPASPLVKPTQLSFGFKERIVWH